MFADTIMLEKTVGAAATRMMRFLFLLTVRQAT
jgi:hypothetical protein